MWGFAILFGLLPAATALFPRSPLTARYPGLETRARSSFEAIDSSILDNFGNIRYATNITVNGKTFRVAIDTGSADLWIQPSADFAFNSTGKNASFEYGANADTDTNWVNGTIGLATVEMGGYTVPNQVFMNATTPGARDLLRSGDSGAMADPGMDGLIGLAFDKLSQLDRVMDDDGDPFLLNIFRQAPAGQDHFVGIALSRTDDMEGTAEASFTINEVDSTYSNVTSAPHVPLFPGLEDDIGGRWSILVDSITVDNASITVPNLTSTVPRAPSGSYVFVLDTGAPSAAIPTDLFNAIYQVIPGAMKLSDGWQLPCNTTSILRLKIGGVQFPIHPLDLSVQNSTGCFSSLQAIDPVPGEGFDGILGDSILRNMYQIYHWGVLWYTGGNASVQLLPLTDPTAAVADVSTVRMARISNQTSGAMVAAAGAADTESSSGDSDSQVKKYGPIVVGLVGANLLVALILAIIGLVLCVKRGAKSGPRTKYARVQVAEEESKALDRYDERPYSD
ncbi:aspartic peptidase domain-containing protein [Mycena polygramma]|nr:aspartic peptidase domain-containing protein [Mycena polygramma]